MQTASTFLETGWDFVDETENGPNDVWKIIEGQTYPLLSWQKYGGGMGEPNDPYLIYTAEHLNALGSEPNDYGKHFKLMADIDLSRRTYDRAVIAPDVNDLEEGFQGSHFVGVFDGNGHIISGLKIDGDSFLGLFGSTLLGAEISNLGLESVDVHGISNYVGGLVGKNGGPIIASWVNVSSCFSSGRVNGHRRVGGLVGYNGSKIVTSYSTCAVEGSWAVGGLVGQNAWGMAAGAGAAANPRGTIIMSYSTGSVAGDVAVGSLVGYGTFSSVSGFWDKNTSGQTESRYGIGLTTAEMQTASTFLEAGWDFIGETENGTEDIWWILEGQDYPRLWWEGVAVLVVDDFESYDDEVGNRLFDIWIDGYDIPENGSSVGCDWPGDFQCPQTAHGGAQSMPMRYDNSGPAHHSQAKRTWETPQDWTIDEADALTLYFRGEVDNDPEPLYTAIEDSAGQIVAVGHPNAGAVLATEWQEWHIALADLQADGVDVAAVEKMSIGIGDRDDPQLGGTGRIYIDDIRLTSRMP